MPASSTPVERIISTAGESSCGKRNRLADKHLEWELLLHKNRDNIGLQGLSCAASILDIIHVSGVSQLNWLFVDYYVKLCCCISGCIFGEQLYLLYR